jgi:XTP/dITP diphosphohydrolase
MQKLRILFATKNQGKAQEVRKILESLPVEILTLAEFPDGPEVMENGETFRDNALKKARELSSHWQGLTLADDSGLEVDALRGEPGVSSARYAGEGATDDENNRKLIEELEGIPHDQRTARFRCVLALVHPEGREWIVEETCKGLVADQPRGKQGFGYDPLFIVPALSRTFAELAPDEKNQISHRAKALSRLRSVLEDILRDESI